MDLLFDDGNGRLDLLGFLSLLARRPVKPPQAVEYRSADLVLRIGLQLDLVRGVEVVEKLSIALMSPTVPVEIRSSKLTLSGSRS